jgi:membrane associated rhomboid family serine protease
MKLNAVSLFLLTLGLVAFLLYFLTRDTVYCSVHGSGLAAVNGYYAANNGMYSKIGYQVQSIPDIFQLWTLQRYSAAQDGVIMFVKGNWLIASSHPNAKVVYHTDPVSTAVNIQHPPSTGWMVSEAANNPIPTSVQCSGSLEDSPADGSSGNSNIGTLIARPITTLLLATICYYAYYLWANRVEVSAVAYSYDAIINKGEYWRMVSASFSHFDLLHLGFNCMGFYQLGMLEPVYSSFTFAYLNVALVFITMIICLLIHSYLIHRMGRTDYATQLSVGYSCVLFAWMVALSVRLPEFCPIMFFPSFCLKTYHLSIPYLLPESFTIPFNWGPFLLLIFTQIILTRASFIGHLSGILIGYPLAWNLLDFLHPLHLAILLIIAYIVVEQLFLWKYYQSYQQQVVGQSLAPLSEFVEANSLKNYRYFLYFSLLIFIPATIGNVVLSAPSETSGWISLVFQYLLLCYLISAAVLSRRVSYYSSFTPILAETGKVFLVLFGYVTVFLIYQYCNVLMISFHLNLLTMNGLEEKQIMVWIGYTVGMIFVEMIYLYMIYQVMKEVPYTAASMAYCKFDEASIREDSEMMKNAVCYLCIRRGGVNPNDLDRQDLTVFNASAGNRIGGENATYNSASNSNRNTATGNPLHNDEENQHNNNNNHSRGLFGGMKIPSITNPASTLTPTDGIRYDRLPTAEASEVPMEDESTRKKKESNRQLLANAAMNRRSPTSSERNTPKTTGGTSAKPKK